MTDNRDLARWPRLLTHPAAIAAVIAAGAVAVVAILNFGPPDTPLDASPSASAPPASGSPTAAATDASSTAAPTQTPPPSGAAVLPWSEGVAPEGQVYVVEWLMDRWIAAGGVGGRAATWTSTDGLTWEPGAPIDPEPQVDSSGFPDGYEIFELIEFNDELLAFGWRRFGGGDGLEPVMWRSDDGINWTVVVTAGRFATSHVPVEAVVAPTGELVLMSGTGLGSSTSIFTSTDARTWEMHVLTQPGEAAMHSVAASPTMLVGVGARFGEPLEARVWTSADGRTWAAATPPSPSADLRTIAWDSANGQFVAAGADEAGRPTVWLSTDASSWSAVGLDEEPGAVAVLSAAEGLIVAIGTVGVAPSDATTTWGSYDASTWDTVTVAQTGGYPVVGVGGGSAVVWLLAGTFEPGGPVTSVLHVWAARPD